MISAGDASCTVAMNVVDRYLNDPSIDHSGNTWSSEFDGWLCATPTAAASDAYGYVGQCTQADNDIRIVSGAAAPVAYANIPAAPPPTDACDASDISDGLGYGISVIRCYGNWAYVTNGELGDSTSLAQLHSDGWRQYAGFPTTTCRSMAVDDGVPAQELTSFPPCVSQPGGP